MGQLPLITQAGLPSESRTTQVAWGRTSGAPLTSTVFLIQSAKSRANETDAKLFRAARSFSVPKKDRGLISFDEMIILHAPISFKSDFISPNAKTDSSGEAISSLASSLIDAFSSSMTLSEPVFCRIFIKQQNAYYRAPPRRF